jgi:hypothetical protein
MTPQTPRWLATAPGYHGERAAVQMPVHLRAQPIARIRVGYRIAAERSMCDTYSRRDASVADR